MKTPRVGDQVQATEIHTDENGEHAFPGDLGEIVDVDPSIAGLVMVHFDRSTFATSGMIGLDCVLLTAARA